MYNSLARFAVLLLYLYIGMHTLVTDSLNSPLLVFIFYKEN